MALSEVTNNQAESRYELAAEGSTAIAAYRLSGKRIVFTHTEVPTELEGRGIASALIRGALDDARAKGLKVVPACAFVRGYVEKHPEYQDLLA
jgi:predicted GNAT family acetyltransferase